MTLSIDELLGWARQHEDEDWTTLRRRQPFQYHVTDSGIVYIPASGIARYVPRKELASFCEEYLEVRSDSPGAYPHRWHKSYSLPLIKRFLRDREES